MGVRVGIAVENPQLPERSERREDLQRKARPFAKTDARFQVRSFERMGPAKSSPFTIEKKG